MQPEHDMPILREDNNRSDNFRSYENEKCTPKVQDIEKDHRDLVDKSSDTGSHVRVERIPQDELLGNGSSSSLRDVRFGEQEFPAGTLVSNIKYDHLGLQNDNLFYLFYNQLDYVLAHYFTESETTKGNVDKFLFNLLMVLLTGKLSYQNTNKWLEKFQKYHEVFQMTNRSNISLNFKVIWPEWPDKKL